MRLGEAIPKYQAYRNQLQEQKKNIYQNMKDAQEKADRSGEEEWSKKAAELEISYKAAEEEFDKYESVLDRLKEQWVNIANAENDRALTDPETGMAATVGKIMTTVARMCAGDKVPILDEKKLMEYDSSMYAKAKEAQAAMAAIKEKQKEYDSLWDGDEGENYDPEGVANNAQAEGDLPEIPEPKEIQAEETPVEEPTATEE